jgi:exodeoxyribonuclease V alpha subunit
VVNSMDLFSSPDDTNNDIKQQPLFVTGKVSAIFFESHDSFFKVLLVKIQETNIESWHEDQIVITGDFADIDEDTDYTFFGSIVEHPKYGKQLKATNYQSKIPTSQAGLIEYLSGDNFPGIGKKSAERLVNTLGQNLISDLLKDTTILDKVDLSNKQKETLITSIQKSNGIEQVIIGLNSYGFGSALSASIYNHYKENTLKVIRENPYKLVEDIDGVGFKRADDTARQLGLAANNPGRIRAGLLTALKSLTVKTGDIYTDARSIEEATLSLLNNGNSETISGDDLYTPFIQLAKDQKIIGEDNRVYLKELYDNEWRIAEHINRIVNNAKNSRFSDNVIDKKIRLIEKKLNINYDKSQIAALKQAIKSPMFLLTGGPGTGKTTIIKGIIYLYAYLNDFSLNLDDYKNNNFPILLAAPTGRAAKRMHQTSGLPASTIHRLLGLNKYEDSDENTKDLEGGLLIVDEMSMVDTSLFRALVRSIPNQMQVILVGDKDQLPSVGPGQVFADLLNSGQINQMHLENIYRQNSDSTIIPLAHSIQQGKLPVNFTQKQMDRSFIPCQSNQMAQVIEQIVKKAKMKGYSLTDIQILAPMYRGASGVNHLNEVIQNIMNPDGVNNQVEYRDMHFRLGDKVLQLVNSPEDNVFNGDIGQITNIIHGSKTSLDKITVSFDQSEVTYQRKDWIQITLAYCTTIHKAQGSEFKMVILPMVSQFTKMLKKNLLYTAITRTSDTLIMIGDYNAFLTCVQNESDNRHTTLEKRIITLMSDEIKSPIGNHAEVFSMENYDNTNNIESKSSIDLNSSKPEQYLLTKELIENNSIDPMIGMDGIRP